MVKRQLSKLFYGNKGFVFALDAAFAITIVAVVLIGAHYYINIYSSETASSISMLKTGYDIVSVLDQQDTFSFSDDAIKAELLQMLPVNYDIRLKVLTLNSSNETEVIVVETTTENPENRLIGTGERVVVTGDLEYKIVKFWMWVK